MTRIPSIGYAIAIGKILMPSLLLVACEHNQKQALMSDMEQQKIELTHQVELQKYRLAKTDTGEIPELKRFRTQINQSAGLLSGLKFRKSVAQEQVATLQAQFAKLREQTIADRRHAAYGQTYDTLRLASGREFEKVSVISIDDTGVAIRHSVGTARLRYSDLDQSQRVQFGIEADSAIIALEKEAQAASVYDKAISTQIAAIQEKQAIASSLKIAADLAENQEKSRFKTIAMNDASASIAAKPRALAEPAVPVGRRAHYTYGSSYDRYPNNSTFVRYYNVVPTYTNVQPLFGVNPSYGPGEYVIPTVQYNQPSQFSTICEP
jgi:DNA gyrase/topoisomerase IV subunit A